MISNWDKAFEHVIKSEAGFQSDPHDSGNHLPDGRAGCTMLGCTQTNWEAYVGHQVTWDDMKALKPDDVKPLYKRDYWDAVKGDALSGGVDYAAFDFAINAGPAASRKMIQRALGVNPDGVIGPATMAAINAMDGKVFLDKFSQAKRDFYIGLHNPTYEKGWLTRVEDVKKIAITMLG